MVESCPGRKAEGPGSQLCLWPAVQFGKKFPELSILHFLQQCIGQGSLFIVNAKNVPQTHLGWGMD